MLATITSKGRVTIPKQVREELQLNSGDRIRFIFHDDRLLLSPITRSVTELKGMLPKPQKPVDLDAMN